MQVRRIEAAHLQPSVRADTQDVPFGQTDDLLAARQKTAPGKGFFQDVGRAGITDQTVFKPVDAERTVPVSYTHLRAHETGRNLVCRLLLEKKNAVFCLKKK